MISTHQLIDDADLRQIDGRVVISIDPRDAMRFGAILRAVASFGRIEYDSAAEMFDNAGRMLMDARPYAYSQAEYAPENARPDVRPNHAEPGRPAAVDVGTVVLVSSARDVGSTRIGRVLPGGGSEMTRVGFGEFGGQTNEWVPTSCVRPVYDGSGDS